VWVWLFVVSCATFHCLSVWVRAIGYIADVSPALSFWQALCTGLLSVAEKLCVGISAWSVARRQASRE